MEIAEQNKTRALHRVCRKSPIANSNGVHGNVLPFRMEQSRSTPRDSPLPPQLHNPSQPIYPLYRPHLHLLYLRYHRDLPVFLYQLVLQLLRFDLLAVPSLVKLHSEIRWRLLLELLPEMLSTITLFRPQDRTSPLEPLLHLCRSPQKTSRSAGNEQR